MKKAHLLTLLIFSLSFMSAVHAHKSGTVADSNCTTSIDANFVNDGSSPNLGSGEGSGTASDPYIIKASTNFAALCQLQDIKNHAGLHYRLGMNIDASNTSVWDNNKGFIPINFSGSLDGNGFTISNLNINRASSNDIGFIGTLTGELQNIALTNVSITGHAFIGALAGNNAGTVGDNNSVSGGTISGDNNYIGGLVGYNDVAGSIGDNNSANVTVRGETASGVTSGAQIGGFVGRNRGDIGTGNYAKGAVHGVLNIGGFVGLTTSEAGDIRYAYATGKVTSGNSAGHTGIGGFAGYADSAIQYSFSYGDVEGYSDTGAFIGYGDANASIRDNMATGNTLNGPNAVNNIGGFSGEIATGGITSGNTYINLYSVTESTFINGMSVSSCMFDQVDSFLSALIDHKSNQNLSTVNNPIGISNACELQLIELDLNAHYALMNNITMRGLFGSRFQPIGRGNSSNGFSGTFDGNEYLIDELIIATRETEQYVGLFSIISGTVKDFAINIVYIIGQKYIGVVAGQIKNGTIDNIQIHGGNIYAYAEDVDSFVYAGGIVGEVIGSLSSLGSNSYASVNVYGSIGAGTNRGEVGQYLGGFAGAINGGSIGQSNYATGEISGLRRVGGFVGSLAAGLNISVAYATGNVIANEANINGTGTNGGTAGGFAGENQGTIANSFSLGTVYATRNAGVFLGNNIGSASVVRNNYSLGNVISPLGAITTAFVGSNAGTDTGNTYANFTETTCSKEETSSFLVEVIEANDAGTSLNSANNPITINSICGIQLITIEPQLYYALETTIDATVTNTWNSGQGFSPIGNTTTPFSGGFDGGNYPISNLYINRSGSNVGLFSVVNLPTNAMISNMLLTEATITGNTNVGGLIGNFIFGSIRNIHNMHSTITGVTNIGGLIGGNTNNAHITAGTCYAQDITVTGATNVGGFIGNHSGTITNGCYTTGLVTGSIGNTGGFVGNNNGDISSGSFSTATVKGINNVGGFVGDNTGTIGINSYATGDVNGVLRVGSFVGRHSHETDTGGNIINQRTISQAYALGDVTGNSGSGGRLGGFVGENNAIIEDSFTVGSVAGFSNIGGFAGRSDNGSLIRVFATGVIQGTGSNIGLGLEGLIGTSAVQNSTGSYYTPIDLSALSCGKNVSKAFIERIVTHNITSSVSETITIDNPIEIGTLCELQLVDISPNLYYRQTATIDATDTENWNTGQGFNPISIFVGHYDGNEQIISNLYINRPTEDNMGLFGESTGTIQNLSLTNVDVTGADNTGGMIGNLTSSTTNVYVMGGFVTGKIDVGGVIGESGSSAVINHGGNCYAKDITVKGQTNTGGFIGNNNGMIAANCYSQGLVLGTTRGLGGFAGNNQGEIGNNSYSVASVYGASTANETLTASDVGGFVGINGGTIGKNSYATGNVDGADDVGGFVGENQAVATVLTEVYALGDVTGTDSIGGFVGDNDATIEHSFTVGNVSGLVNVGAFAGDNSSGTIRYSYGSGSVAINGKTGIGDFEGIAGSLTGSFHADTSQATTACGKAVSRNFIERVIMNNVALTPIISTANPINISNICDLQLIKIAPSLDYGQTTAIDASLTENWSNQEGFDPIASFSGSYQGGGNTISNLYIKPKNDDGSAKDNAGLFGTTSGSVTGLGLINVDIVGGNNTGALAGQSDGATLSEVYVDGGNVQATANAGGLVGYSQNSEVTDAHADNINITGESDIGGLIANARASTVTNAYTINADISGTNNRAGGLIAYLNGGVVTDVYTEGVSVSATTTIGGLIAETANNAVVGNGGHCYAKNITLNGQTNVGGLVGSHTATLSNGCYTSGNVYGRNQAIGGLVGINNVSGIIGNNSSATVTVYGSSTSSITILTADQVGGFVGRNLGLIGTNNFAIGDVRGNEIVGGFVGTNEATIENSFSVGNITGNNAIGAFAGNNSGIINYSYATGSVTRSGFSIGGLIGTNGGTLVHGFYVDMSQDATSCGKQDSINHLLVIVANDLSPSNSASNPINVNDLCDLQITKIAPTLYYEQTASIDANQTRTWHGGDGFTPISPFSGVYDANGNTISNLYIGLDSSINDVGLFGEVSGAVSNLSLINVEVTGGNNTGGLVGYLKDGTVTDTHASIVDISGENYIGGLIGRVQRSTATNVYMSDGNISGSEEVGGLIGNLDGNLMGNVYSDTAFVTGEMNVGGLIGSTEANGYTNASNCYAKDIITVGQTNVGGFIGLHQGSVSDGCYSSGTVLGSVTNIGGFIGHNQGMTGIENYSAANVYGASTSTETVLTADNVGGFIGNNLQEITNSYSLGNASGNNHVGGFIGSNNASTITNSYAVGAVNGSGTNIGGFLGSNTGLIDDGYYLDMSMTSCDITVSQAFIIDVLTGTITRNNNKAIDNVCNLQLMGLAPNLFYQQTAIIDAAPTSTWNNGKGLEPLGKASAIGFSGRFETPTTHTITNLTINRPDESHVGLFSILSSAGNIDNIHLRNITVKGNSYVGGLAGLIINGVVNRSNTSGLVEGSGTGIGGLVGKINKDSTLADENSSAAIVLGSSASTAVGGVIGHSEGDINSAIFATGSVTGGSFVGGLIGFHAPNNTTSDIDKSYALGAVQAAGDIAGGLIGFMRGGRLIETYAQGSVSGANRIGGLVGYFKIENSETGSITNSYAQGNIEATTSGASAAGSLIGRAETNRVDNVISVRNSYGSGEVSIENLPSVALIGEYIGVNINDNGVEDSYATGTYSDDTSEFRSFAQLQCPSKPYLNSANIPSGTANSINYNCLDAVTYERWNTNLWAFGNGKSLPILKTLNDPLLDTNIVINSPTNLTPDQAHRSLLVQWQAPANTENVTQYTIYWSPADNNSRSKDTQNSAIGTSFTIDNLINNTTYTVTIVSSNGYQDSEKTDASSNAPMGTADAVENFALTPGDTTIAVSWEPPANPGNAEGITGYSISYMSTQDAERTTMPAVNAVDRSATKTNLINGIEYTVFITAVNSYGEGDESMSNATPLTKSALKAPGLTLTSEDNTIIVDWVPPDVFGYFYGIANYKIRYRLSDESGQEVTVLANESSRQLTISSLQNNRSYTVSIVAVDDVGVEGDSDVGQVTPNGPPDAVINLEVSAFTTSSLTIDWDEASTGSDPSSYTVAWSSAANTTETTTISATAASSYSFKIENLTKGSLYTIVVFGLNAAGQGDKNSIMAIPSSRPSEVQNLVINQLNATTINVSWDAPLEDGGLTVDYIVRWVISQEGEIKEAIRSTTNHSISIESNEYYEIFVIARNARGESSPVSTSFGATFIVTPTSIVIDNQPVDITLTTLGLGNMEGTIVTEISNGGITINPTFTRIPIVGNETTFTVDRASNSNLPDTVLTFSSTDFSPTLSRTVNITFRSLDDMQLKLKVLLEGSE